MADRETTRCPHGIAEPGICPQCDPATYERARLQAEETARRLGLPEATDAAMEAGMSEGPQATDEDAARWRHHLDALLRRPGETIILGGVSSDGSMSLQVGGDRVADLLWVARSLIEQAQDRGAGAFCQAALDALPDPLADDSEDDAGRLTGLAPAEEWRDAVLDAMVCWEMWPQDGETPKQALNRLLAWEQQVALDPAVSEAAAKQRRAALEAAAVLVREVHDGRIRRGRGGFTSHAMMECQDAIRRLAHG